MRLQDDDGAQEPMSSRLSVNPFRWSDFAATHPRRTANRTQEGPLLGKNSALHRIRQNPALWKTCQAFRLRYESVVPHFTPLPSLYSQRYLAVFSAGLGISDRGLGRKVARAVPFRGWIVALCRDRQLCGWSGIRFPSDGGELSCNNPHCSRKPTESASVSWNRRPRPRNSPPSATQNTGCCSIFTALANGPTRSSKRS